MKANDPNSDRVRFTTDLAHRLGVSRQSINHWRRRIDAPQKQADGWNVPAWQDYMRHKELLYLFLVLMHFSRSLQTTSLRIVSRAQIKLQCLYQQHVTCSTLI